MQSGCSHSKANSDGVHVCSVMSHFGLSQEEYWSGLPSSPGNLPNPGIKPASPESLNWQTGSLSLSHLGGKYRGQVGGKESLFYFGCQQLGRGWVWILSKGWLLPNPNSQGAWASAERGRGLYTATARSALMGILKLVISGLSSVMLIGLSS